MVVTAYYTDDQSRAVTGYTYSPTGTLDMDDTTITISYTEGSVTKTDHPGHHRGQGSGQY